MGGTPPPPPLGPEQRSAGLYPVDLHRAPVHPTVALPQQRGVGGQEALPLQAAPQEITAIAAAWRSCSQTPTS